MLLFELDNPKSKEEQAEDNSIALKSDTRKTRLTLEQLSKLRKLADLKIVEYHKNIEEVRRQFAAPAGE